MQKVYVLSVALLIALGGISCRAAIESSGSRGASSVTLRLGGFLPASRTAAASVSRFVLPITNAIHVTVQRPSDMEAQNGIYLFDRIWDISSGTSSVTVGGLPDGEALYFAVNASQISEGTENILSSGYALTALEVGQNELSLAMQPASWSLESTVAITPSSIGTASPIDFGYSGGAAFWQLDFSVSGDYQILMDTGSSAALWLGIYDTNWAPVALVAGSMQEGWGVIHATASSSYYVAAAHCLDNPGFLSGNLSGTVSVRPAVFVNAGTDLSTMSLYDGSSYFLEAGAYPLSAYLSLLGDVCIYGGFKGGDWTVRDPSRYPAKVQATGSETSIALGDSDSGFSGCLDGLTVVAPAATSSFSSLSAVQSYKAVSPAFLRNCTLESTSSGSFAPGVYLAALRVYSSTMNVLEVSGCRLSGSAVTGQTDSVNTMALSVSAGTVYVHNSDLDGGSVSAAAGATTAKAYTYGAYVSSGGAVLAGCRIWGGRAVSLAGATATATAVYYVSTTAGAKLVVANNMISGGSASSTSVNTYGIVSSSGSPLVVGNVIDAGYTEGATAASWCISDVDGAASGTFTASANVFLSSNSETDMLFYESSANLLSFAGNLIYGRIVSKVLSNAGTAESLTADNAIADSALSSLLTSYCLVTGPFDSWASSNLWTPTAAPTGSVSGSTVLSSYAAAYPALVLDLAGNPRPTGAWKPGAYE